VICPDCGEIVADDHRYHPDCCPHSVIDDEESADGNLLGWCSECGAQVILMPPDEKDGQAYWESYP
jgi:hypothetical protein